MDRRTPRIRVAAAAVIGIFLLSFLVSFVIAGLRSLKNAPTMSATSTSDATLPATTTSMTSPSSPLNHHEPPSQPADAPFSYTFNVAGVLEEASSPRESTSPYWWLSSGGELLMGNDIGSTLQGEVQIGNPWRAAYARTSAVDTDGGSHPQNLFRLVSKRSWTDASLESSFLIKADNLSASPNRNGSNGLFLMSRYQDQDTLYYAGVRVDGTAVIKKKYHGTYYTLAQTVAYPGAYGPNEPNLLPHSTWITLRADTVTLPGGAVRVTLYRAAQGAWEELASAVDRGTGGPPITAEGSDGIRTDFMDVEFSTIRITPRQP